MTAVVLNDDEISRLAKFDRLRIARSRGF